MTEYRAFTEKQALIDRQRLVAVLKAIRCFGELLRKAAVIAFTMRCKVVDLR